MEDNKNQGKGEKIGDKKRKNKNNQIFVLFKEMKVCMTTNRLGQFCVVFFG